MSAPSHRPSNIQVSSRPWPYRRDPLLNERALVMGGCDYVNGAHMTRERIDQVIAKLKEDGQIPDHSTLETDLARRALAAGLKPIYQPFHDYVREEIHKGRDPPQHYRNGRDPMDATYHGLHDYLMKNHMTEQAVLDYIQLHKKDPKAVEQYELSREHDMYGKYGSFQYTNPQNPFTRPLGSGIDPPSTPRC